MNVSDSRPDTLTARHHLCLDHARKPTLRRPSLRAAKAFLVIIALSCIAHARAQSVDDIPQPAPAPDTEEIESALRSSGKVHLFARVYELSGLSLRDFQSRYVTFLAPLDVSCHAEQRFHLERLNSKKAAIEYIRDHVFYGSIADFGGRKPRVTYHPAGTDLRSPPTTVLLGEFDEFRSYFVSGKPLWLSRRDGKLFLGSKAEIVGRLGGFNGSIDYVNDCGDF